MKIALIALLLVSTCTYRAQFEPVCEEDKRILTRDELLTRATPKLYSENPYCCDIYPKPPFQDDYEILINRLFGYHNYGLSLYIKDSPRGDLLYPHYEKHTTVTACGKIAGNTHGMSMSNKTYEATINRIREKVTKRQSNLKH